MAEVIDGRTVASSMAKAITEDVRRIVERQGQPPGLAVIQVGDDGASQVYVARKIEECAKVGIHSIEHRLAEATSQDDLLKLIHKLNNDSAVHGILVQLPLPGQIDSTLVLDSILPAKDVDGFHPVNVGRLSTGTGGLTPCTPLGVMRLLETVIEDFRGLEAVVVGKSNIVGKPIAMLLLEREATVTVTHIETRSIADVARKADIVIAAAGVPRLVRGYWIKEGAIVIDVGITRVVAANGRTKLVGDVAFDEMQHARAVTPVPGGVGPMTIACLLANTVKANWNALEQVRNKLE